MSRLTLLHRDQLDDQGSALWDHVVSSRGAVVVRPDGALAGPFNAWVTVPDLGQILVQIGSRLRFGTSIERRLLELAIVTVGARWQAEFEWWAHARMARQHGISEDVLTAIAAGRMPDLAADERLVHLIASQLAAEGHIEDDAYGAGVALLGERGMVELVSLCGYYTLVSFTLNAFTVELPDGVQPTWPTSSQPSVEEHD
jgi:4-carboxymuconolactone decarboxylase